jgi:hypothetical protein
MSVSPAELTALWGPDGVIEVPADLLGDVLAPGVLPAGAALPVEVPILFTADVTVPGMTPFGKLNIEIGDEGPRIYVILGSSPEDAQMLYCLDSQNGSVVLLDLGTPNFEDVNTSFAAFVEFLYRLGQLIDTDPGGRARAERAAAIRADLMSVDPSAFSDPESWWSMAFGQLEATAA